MNTFIRRFWPLVLATAGCLAVLCFRPQQWILMSAFIFIIWLPAIFGRTK
jgi:hypothetical protein